MNLLSALWVFWFLFLEANCLRLVKKDSPAVVGATISKRTSQTNVLLRDRIRRKNILPLGKRQSSTGQIDIKNEISLYIIEMEVGTPAQSVSLHLDTGSSDMWVNTPQSTLCQRHATLCDELGVYRIGSSSTASFVSNDFKVTYADGSTAHGAYIKDKVSVGDFTLNSLQFGLANYSTTPGGILGIGYRLGEGVVSQGVDETYLNLPADLAKRGLINSNAYSLWLNDLSASEGEILFGGVNRAKYQGKLRTIPVVPINSFYTAFIVVLSDIGINGKTASIARNQGIPVLLDSGTTLIYLPDSIAEAIFDQFGTSYNRQDGGAPVPCSTRDQQDSVLFTFSGVTIRVPINELVLDLTSDGSACVLGIAPGGNTLSILGDTFLRSAYVVYDLSNNQISLAQTRFNAAGNDIVEIAAGEDGVPGATDVTSTASLGSTPTARIGSTTSTLNPSGSDNNSSVRSIGLQGNAMFWIALCLVIGATTLRAF